MHRQNGGELGWYDQWNVVEGAGRLAQHYWTLTITHKAMRPCDVDLIP